jgi:hypothetical protein
MDIRCLSTGVFLDNCTTFGVTFRDTMETYGDTLNAKSPFGVR